MISLNFNPFRDACHTASRDAGWWRGSQRYGWTPAKRWDVDPDRINIPTKLCLIHSEISEAYDGYVTGADDEHLPQYKSAAVEFADAQIRVGDLAGYLDLDMTAAIFVVNQADALEMLVQDGGCVPAPMQREIAFNRLHTFTSAAMEGYRKSAQDDHIPGIAALPANLARVVILCDLIAGKNGWNLPEIAEAKMAYNAVRLDHKAETRAMAGGKTF